MVSAAQQVPLDEWVHMRNLEGPQWQTPGPILKLGGHGRALYTELHPDGTLTERAVERWDRTWSGSWRRTARALEVNVGPYRLSIADGSHSGLEVNLDKPTEQPQPFAIFAVAEPHSSTLSNERIAVIKFVQKRSAIVGELHPHGMLREYDLLGGWSAGDWHGRWSFDKNRLQLSVGEYTWAEDEQRAPGYRIGTERSRGESTVFPTVTVKLAAAQTQWPVGRGIPEDTEPIFTFDGFDFFSPSAGASGYFASVLQVRRRSAAGGVQLFAAKCTRAGSGNSKVARREISIAEKISATDGLVAAFGSFVLPKELVFGEFGGALVQILEWADTDLARYVNSDGAMSIADLLSVARDIASALSALHAKFHLVHADVRPANVVGRRTGHQLSWRLVDFNVTSQLNPGTGSAPYLGTSEVCISPEWAHRRRSSAQDKSVRPSDDVWALGLILVQCALGSVWNAGERIKRAHADELPDLVPIELRPIVAGALAKESRRWSASKVHAYAVRMQVKREDKEIHRPS
ncbi:hypothetical protein C5D04_00420 [Rathayibacter sp. AY1D2]|nr:hypothetical protein C5D04_00420 [Rathayibacter sp. AY1D2]